MKKIALTFLILSGIIISCKEETPPPPKPSNQELIVGTWQSTIISDRKYVQDKLIGSFDDPDTDIIYNFLDNFYFFSIEDSLYSDTVRYNFEGDSLYLIKNARAFDTLYISLLDAQNLHLLLDVSTTTVNGMSLREEVVAEFIRTSE